MAKLTKKQLRNLGILIVIGAVIWWFWQGQQAAKEHGGKAVKEHAGKEHAGKTK